MWVFLHLCLSTFYQFNKTTALLNIILGSWGALSVLSWSLPEGAMKRESRSRGYFFNHRRFSCCNESPLFPWVLNSQGVGGWFLEHFDTSKHIFLWRMVISTTLFSWFTKYWEFGTLLRCIIIIYGLLCFCTFLLSDATHFLFICSLGFVILPLCENRYIFFIVCFTA